MICILNFISSVRGIIYKLTYYIKDCKDPLDLGDVHFVIYIVTQTILHDKNLQLGRRNTGLISFSGRKTI